MKKIIYIFLTFFVFSFSPTIFANNVGIFNDVKIVKEAEKEENIYKNFLKEYKLENFIKNWLSDEENKKLRKIILDYISSNSDLEQKLQKIKNENEILKIQNSILDLKKDLYKKIIPYIEQKSYKNYLNHIENTLKNFIEKNSPYKNNQINSEEKVNTLEKKIQENKQNLNSEVRNLIEEKFDEKISVIIDSPSFSKLSTENKIKTLGKVIENLNSKVITFQKRLDYSSIYIESDKKRLEIYKIMLQKLIEISYNLK